MTAIIPNPVDSLYFENDYFNQDIKNIYDQINSGNAFKNPLSGVFSTFTTNVTSATSELEDLLVSPPGTFTMEDIQGFIDTTAEIEENHALFLGHTNRLSGVDLTNGTANNTQHLLTLFSVGQSSVALEHTLNEAVGNPCGKLLNVFGSLFLGPDLYAQINNYYQELIGLINNAEALASQIQSQLESFKNSIETLIENDRTYFDNLVSDLLRAALAQSLPGIFEDPCGRYVIERTIGKTGLLNVL